MRIALLLIGILAAPQLWAQAISPDKEVDVDEPAVVEREENCTDRKDNDGDTVYDCGDSDCAKDAACQPDGGDESTNERCGDWIDNDRDGFTDCDDRDCEATGISVCQGSWDTPPKVASQAGATDAPAASVPNDDIPTLGSGMTVEDLIGTGADNDGERNDVLCSDGVDNDDDGRVDCADFGCRFDANVTVCRGNPGFRFSVVSQITQSYDFEEEEADTRFSTLQLRAFGPLPLIQDSFFLLSMRAERTPRLTFAMFQVPIGGGHYVNINSGGGGLSNALVTSAAKRLLIDPPFYVYNAFEQGNGAAFEVGGPIGGSGKLKYRAFVAGGSGRFAGNVGGTFITFNNTNYTYSVGAQVRLNAIGFYNRWDSPYIYVPAQTALHFALGVKYDQRAQERYPALNLQAVYRKGRFIVLGESYSKRELEFKSWQLSYNVMAGFLLIKKRLMFAADFGEYLSSELDDPPAVLETDLLRQLQETQWRAALHLYVWRNIGILSVVYSDRQVDPRPGQTEDQVFREIKAVAQYRF